MTTHLDPAPVPPPQGPGEDPHRSLHSEAGALPGEHPGRSRNPLVKAAGLAWLEFEKPDLDRAERFGTDFGFTVADRTNARRAAAARRSMEAVLRPTGGQPPLPARRRRHHRDDRLA